MDSEIKGIHKRSRTNERGFSLTELMMAATLFALLSLALFSTISSASTIFQMQTLNAGINQGGMQLIRSIAREIAESSPLTDLSHLTITPDASANSIVSFQVPVDFDHDGNIVQDNLTQTVEWGAYRFVRKPQSQSWLNGWVRYRVVNNQLLREVLSALNGPVVATDIIVPRDVQVFQLSPASTNRYSILLTILKTDTVNQKGATARTYQTTFDEDVFLRNGG